MTKTYKKVLSIVLAALLLATSLLVLLSVFSFGGTSKSSAAPIKASAATTTNPLADDVFEFKPGAAVYLPDEDEERTLDRLSFSLALKGPKWIKNCDDKDKKEMSTYSFTLHRMQLNGSSEPLARVLIVRSGKVWLYLEQQLAYYDETFYFDPSQPTETNVDVLTSKYTKAIEKLAKSYKEKGYTLKKSYINDASETSDLNWGEDNFFEEPYIRFAVNVNSPVTQYFVRFDYDIKYYVKTEKGWWWWEDDKDIYKHQKGTIDSSARSIYEILKNASEEPAPEEGWESALEFEIIDEDLIEAAYKIIGYANKQIVNIQWLQQIGDTPFAKPVSKKVTITLTDNVLKTDQVASVLNISNFDVIGTTCKEFLYDEASDTYVAQYYKSVYLTSRTADGNTTNPSDSSSAKYFLDINLSYYDYYHKLVDDKVFSEELYEYVYYKNIVSKYPEMRDYKPEEVHGYFGYVVIPNTYTLNSLWKELFDTATSFDGVTVNFCYEDELSYDSYIKLLDEYGYNWAERAWNSIAGFVAGNSYPANHYLFLADVTSEKKNDVHISENGASDAMDENGVIFNETEKAVEELGKVIEETLDTVGGAISNTASETKRTFQIIFGIVAGGLLIVFGAWVYRKVVPTKTTSRRRKKK